MEEMHLHWRMYIYMLMRQCSSNAPFHVRCHCRRPRYFLRR